MALVCFGGNTGTTNQITDRKSPAAIQFLNDRAADIIGSRPLTVPKFINDTGLTGKGQIIGIADSGLDLGSLKDLHPDLRDSTEGEPKVVGLRSWAGREVADDPIGHGTHMAATAVGTGSASDGKYQGVAPGASLYFQGLLNTDNQLQTPADLQKLWQAAYGAGVRIHINAWGGGENLYTKNAAEIDSFSDQNKDFLPIFAAGNNGPNTGTLTAEANSKNALVIGASQSSRPAFSSEADDTQKAADSSSRGPTKDNRIKPDLVAPGSAVVSAASQLISGNYPANTQYTLMSGTSMAAAVTGGAVALLREWFQNDLGTAGKTRQPSAALLKAALINGARLPQGGPNQSEGFGVLDLSNTVVALQEKSFQFQDITPGLKTGETVDYRFRITEKSNQPLKVTLVWTDLPGKLGSSESLVNDLDLVVTGPTGEQYRGNVAIQGNHTPDTQNNVEQVMIVQPRIGEYRITVQARELQELEGENKGIQPFALVYGQPVWRGTVDQINSSGQLDLTNGHKIDLSTATTKQVLNGELSFADFDGQTLQDLKQNLPPGSQVYQAAQAVYLISRTWEAVGIQLLPTTKGLLFVEINNNLREGGYYLDSDRAQALEANGEKVDKAESITVGVEVKAALNPISQTLWQVVTGFVEKKGVVTKIDLPRNKIWLDLESEAYSITPKTALAFSDRVVEGSSENAAYGAGDNPSWGQILPGMHIQMTLSPQSREIQYITVQRELVLGKIKEIDLGQRKVTIEHNNIPLWISAEARLRRDQKIVQLGDLQPGDYITAVVMDSTDTPIIIIQGTVYSRASFARILYYQEKSRNLALINAWNQIEFISLTPSTQIRRRANSVDTSVLQAGTWVRVIQHPDSSDAWRIDLAETLWEQQLTFQGYSRDRKQIIAKGGTSINVGPGTLITKNDYRVGVEDLVPGEKMKLLWLASSAPEGEFLASLEVETNMGTESPYLEVVAQKQGQVVRITGYTSAENLYVYRGNGQRELVPVGGQGYFVWYMDTEPNDTILHLIAISKQKSGMSIQLLDVADMEAFGFVDLDGYWAEKEIHSLSLQGGISGYADGTFRPDQPLNRAELASLVVRLMSWTEPLGSEGLPKKYTDQETIPEWALSAAEEVQRQGLLLGFTDGSFQPLRQVSRGDLAMLLSRLLLRHEALIQDHGERIGSAVYKDINELGAEQKKAIELVSHLELMFGVSVESFKPQEPVTRGEVAFALYHLLEILGE